MKIKIKPLKLSEKCYILILIIKKQKDTCTARSKRAKKKVNKSENNEVYCFLMWVGLLQWSLALEHMKVVKIHYSLGWFMCLSLPVAVFSLYYIAIFFFLLFLATSVFLTIVWKSGTNLTLIFFDKPCRLFLKFTICDDFSLCLPPKLNFTVCAHKNSCERIDEA